MRLKTKPLQNLFSDRSSLVLRALLREPQRKWTIPELAQEGVSFGQVSASLDKAEALGYIQHIRAGRESYSQLIQGEELLKDWAHFYSFFRNAHAFYFYAGAHFLEACHFYLEKHGVPYALTLFSASRLLDPYVKEEGDFLYLGLEPGQTEAFLRDMELEFNFKELKQGGNVCLALPYYKSSVFRDTRKVDGFPVVSDLQLYLDLMGWEPGGPEQAEHFLMELRKKTLPFTKPLPPSLPSTGSAWNAFPV
jgi:hypothetical protein